MSLVKGLDLKKCSLRLWLREFQEPFFFRPTDFIDAKADDLGLVIMTENAMRVFPWHSILQLEIKVEKASK